MKHFGQRIDFVWITDDVPISVQTGDTVKLLNYCIKHLDYFTERKYNTLVLEEASVSMT